MNLAAVGIASLILLLAAAVTKAGDEVTFEVTNIAETTPGGQRFDRDYGVSYAQQVLAASTEFTWEVFDQPSPADRRPIDHVTLLVDAMDDASYPAYTHGSTIMVDAGYVNDYTGDLKTELTGMLCHETVHVWQWGKEDYEENPGIFEGIADYVRLKAGYAPEHWVEPGEGDQWDQGYDVTARFLEYCDSLQPGFVALLNAKLQDGYDEDYFLQILGEDVQQLWQDYKDEYGRD